MRTVSYTHLQLKNGSYIYKEKISGEVVLNFLVFLSTYILPFFIFYVVAYGLLKGRNVYQAFVEGAKGGFHTALGILPTLVGLLAAVGVLRASGFLDLVSGLLKNLLKGTGFPAEILPLVIVRLFSNSAATGLALDLFKAHGPDSHQGLLASLFLSSTETVFYTMSIYFMSVKIKKTRYTLPGALLATLAGIAVSVALVSFKMCIRDRFAWFFHYMPVGNDAVPELMPNPDQRETVYRRIREYRKTKSIFTMDFQNDAEFVHGCVAGGRYYLHINACLLYTSRCV